MRPDSQDQEQQLAALEAALDDFDPAVRLTTLDELSERAGDPPPERPLVNLHAHTFFSFNPYGYSPTHFAWLARRKGLAAAGIVDFDVLDGVEEFHAAGRRIGLKTVASLESRVFVPEFSDQVINSPGEPGISYHMGAGFVRGRLEGEAAEFLADMRARADRRTRDLVNRVNDFLDPVRLDFARDAAPLTPKGNVTERHVCHAYAGKAAAQFPDPARLRAFWEDRLGALPVDIDLPAGPKLQALIRAKTMKKGGVGYVTPDATSFPLMADMDRFSLSAGAVPTLTWLDGTSDGEQDIKRYFEVGRKSGAAALNIIPDRNFTHGVKDQKLANLYEVVDLAKQHHFPVIVGTEMNSPGQRFADDFDSAELQPLVPTFLEGAYILYAHGVLEAAAGLGFASPWAGTRFADPAEQYAFYTDFGRRFRPGREDRLAGLSEQSTPDDVRDALKEIAND